MPVIWIIAANDLWVHLSVEETQSEFEYKYCLDSSRSVNLVKSGLCQQLHLPDSMVIKVFRYLNAELYQWLVPT